MEGSPEGWITVEEAAHALSMHRTSVIYHINHDNLEAEYFPIPERRNKILHVSKKSLRKFVREKHIRITPDMDKFLF